MARKPIKLVPAQPWNRAELAWFIIPVVAAVVHYWPRPDYSAWLAVLKYEYVYPSRDRVKEGMGGHPLPGCRGGSAVACLPERLSQELGAPRYTLGGFHPHHGADLTAPGGTTVVAACSGVVKAVQHTEKRPDGKENGGPFVIIHCDADPLVTRYFHVTDIRVGSGERVQPGQQIAVVRHQERHLHFVVAKWLGGDLDNLAYLDPVPYLTGAVRYE